MIEILAPKQFKTIPWKNGQGETIELAINEGLFAGYTSGAVLQATMQYDKKGFFNKDSVVVLVLPDHGSRYMEKVYSDDWMREQGFFDTQKLAQQEIEVIK